MWINRGNRKLFGFLVLAFMYLVIAVIGTIKGGFESFQELGAGLGILGAPFFIGNGISKAGTKIEK